MPIGSIPPSSSAITWRQLRGLAVAFGAGRSSSSTLITSTLPGSRPPRVHGVVPPKSSVAGAVSHSRVPSAFRAIPLILLFGVWTAIVSTMRLRFSPGRISITWIAEPAATYR